VIESEPLQLLQLFILNTTFNSGNIILMLQMLILRKHTISTYCQVALKTAFVSLITHSAVLKQSGRAVLIIVNTISAEFLFK
jgi:hypothetical protein